MKTSGSARVKSPPLVKRSVRDWSQFIFGKVLSDISLRSCYSPVLNIISQIVLISRLFGI